MAERSGDDVRPGAGADVQGAEQHRADDRDADGAARPLGRAEDGAGRARLLPGHPGQHEVLIRGLADAVAARAPGESLLTAIRRDYADRIAAGDVTLGPPTATFARMVRGSHALTSRSREIADLTEQALGDAIAAETGVDNPQQRIVAAQLVSVHRVLFAEGTRRSLVGQPRDEICQVLAAAASQAFDLLEPSLAGYGIRA
jgi:hypothetical protein